MNCIFNSKKSNFLFYILLGINYKITYFHLWTYLFVSYSHIGEEMTEGAQIQQIQVRYDIKAGGTMVVGLWGQLATRGVVVGTK